MPSPHAEIVCDSISPLGIRVTTFVVRFWRPMLAEFNTHALSRNSESSRAVPFPLRLARVMEDPMGPALMRSEKKGMQGGDEIDDPGQAWNDWVDASAEAAEAAKGLAARGVHKSIVNRLLEPFLDHTVVATGVNWENFFDQRCHPAAQDDIRIPAEMMRKAYVEAVPTPLKEGDWHLPYVTEEDRPWALEKAGGDPDTFHFWLAKISAARCAQLSYLTQPQLDPDTGAVVRPGGTIDPEKDLARYERLMDNDIIHWSPLEHPAMACEQNLQTGILWTPSPTVPRTMHGSLRPIRLNHRAKTGKLPGWLPLRSIMEADLGQDTYR